MQLQYQFGDREIDTSNTPIHSEYKSDNELWEEFRAGSRLAFAKIYEDFIDLLTSYALKITPDKELVKDSIQDVFVDIWKRKEHLSSVSSIKFYLLKSIRRDIIRKKVKVDKKSSIFNMPLNKNIDPQPSFEMILVMKEETTERIEKLRKKLDQLSPRLKEILYLRFYVNLTNEEISEVLGINKQSVYNNIYRALEILRENLTYVIPILVFETKFFD